MLLWILGVSGSTSISKIEGVGSIPAVSANKD